MQQRVSNGAANYSGQFRSPGSDSGGSRLLSGFSVPVPANSTDLSSARLANTTGLVAGVTQLGDELSLLYRQDQINNSVFASMLTWTWNGTAFAP